MGEASVRPATAWDAAEITAIQHTEPSPSILGLAGDRVRGQRLGAALVEAAGVTDPRCPTVVYDRGGQILGFAQYSIGAPGEVALSWRLVTRVVRALGPRVLLLGPRLRARKAVELAIPPESLYLSELQVRSDLRGQGIGGELLEWVEREASTLACGLMSLVTDIGNPAQRLYERHGFEVIETKTADQYRRFTGREGRVLMTKAIARGIRS